MAERMSQPNNSYVDYFTTVEDELKCKLDARGTRYFLVFEDDASLIWFKLKYS
jgi:hypothetical protein